MGYYSTFEVLESDIEDIADQLAEISGYTFSVWNGRTEMSDSGKWYDWDTDLQELADLNPTGYAVLERRGEESPDIERAIVYKGEVTLQQPEITFPVFEQLPGFDTVVKAR